MVLRDLFKKETETQWFGGVCTHSHWETGLEMFVVICWGSKRDEMSNKWKGVTWARCMASGQNDQVVIITMAWWYTYSLLSLFVECIRLGRLGTKRGNILSVFTTVVTDAVWENNVHRFLTLLGDVGSCSPDTGFIVFYSFDSSQAAHECFDVADVQGGGQNKSFGLRRTQNSIAPTS